MPVRKVPRTRKPKDMRIPHNLPPSSSDNSSPSDKITLIAQKYAGYFIGKEYRFDQQAAYVLVGPEEKGIHVSKKKWKEPVVNSDDCVFCVRLTDEEAERRVAGFQHQIDIEVIRSKNNQYIEWLEKNADRLDDVDTSTIQLENSATGQVEVYTIRKGSRESATNKRLFVSECSEDWDNKALPMVNLPLRLKRKMVIEWNHVYRDYMKTHGVSYDFETKQFYKEIEDLSPLECCKGTRFYNSEGKLFNIHREKCTHRPAPEASIEASIGEAWARYFGA